MNSLKHKILPFLVFILIAGFIQAQSLEDIIDNHIKAHGDIEKWDAISSMAIKATFTAFSVEHKFYALKTSKGEYYSDLYIGHQPIKEAFDGKHGWTIDPWYEFNYPRLLNKAEEVVFYQKADFFTPFYKYKEKGHTVEFLGKEMVDGMEAFALKLTRTNGAFETWYLDTKTYLEFKSVSSWIDFAGPIEAEAYYDDFQMVEGVLIPFYMERMFRQRHRVLVIEDVEFNPEYDASIFEMPRSEQMSKLALMAGDWKVKVEMPGRNGELRTADNTSSKVKFTSPNLLAQELSYEAYFVQPMRMNYSYHQTKGKYILTLHSEFLSTTDLFEGEFVDGILIFNEIISKDSEVDAKFQFLLSDIKSEGFVIEMKQSRDKGENWMTGVKFTFTK